MASALSLKEYLKKYENTKEDETKKKKKKKKKKPTTDTKGGVLVVDEDPVWQKPVHLENSDDDEDSPDEKPQINEDIEVKRMKRLELLRSQRPYHAISEDGSGWVSVSDHAATNSNSTNQMADDISPPRRRPRYDTPSPEPENPTTSGNGAGGESDLSPPRQKRKRYDTPSPEPSNLIGRDMDRYKDMSSPRRSRSESGRDYGKNDDDDLSPPRRAARVETADLSPPRRSSRASATEDLSPPRRSKKVVDSADLSPPRRSSRASATEDLSPPRKSKKIVEPRAGLFSAQEIKKEIESKRKEELARYKKLDPSVTGRGAEPVYRDKEGKRISKDEVLKLQKGEEKPKEKKLEWGKGLAQKREAEAKEQELELEKDKPFARTRDDPELDNMLKDRVRWGDPMAHLVKSKHSDLILEDLGDDEKMKESGFIIPQDIPSHSWIKRRLDAAPNRYGIKPGRHWDGVDRSNGYEKEYFKRINEKQATEREAYLWSVSDM